MARLGTASATYSEIIGLAAMTLTEVQELSRILADEGRVITHPRTGNQRPHPCVAQLHRARQRLQSVLAELGLTPASIGKATRTPPPPEINPFTEGR
jgi:phage terminase small subunit